MLNITGSAKVPTTFTGMWQPTMTIGSDAEVRWGLKRLELPLALYNTGSMQSSSKMTQIKLAANRPDQDVAEGGQEAG